jgi:hypothetical protein
MTALRKEVKAKSPILVTMSDSPTKVRRDLSYRYYRVICKSPLRNNSDLLNQCKYQHSSLSFSTP